MRKPTGKRQRPTVMHAHLLRGPDAMIHSPRAFLVGFPSACAAPSPCKGGSTGKTRDTSHAGSVESPYRNRNIGTEVCSCFQGFKLFYAVFSIAVLRVLNIVLRAHCNTCFQYLLDVQILSA